MSPSSISASIRPYPSPHYLLTYLLPSVLWCCWLGLLTCKTLQTLFLSTLPSDPGYATGEGTSGLISPFPLYVPILYLRLHTPLSLSTQGNPVPSPTYFWKKNSPSLHYEIKRQWNTITTQMISHIGQWLGPYTGAPSTLGARHFWPNMYEKFWTWQNFTRYFPEKYFPFFWGGDPSLICLWLGPCRNSGL